MKYAFLVPIFVLVGVTILVFVPGLVPVLVIGGAIWARSRKSTEGDNSSENASVNQDPVSQVLNRFRHTAGQSPADRSMDTSDNDELIRQMHRHIPASSRKHPHSAAADRPNTVIGSSFEQDRNLRAYEPVDIPDEQPAAYAENQSDQVESEFQKRYYQLKNKDRDLEPWDLPPEKPPWEL